MKRRQKVHRNQVGTGPSSHPGRALAEVGSLQGETLEHPPPTNPPFFPGLALPNHT